MSNNGKLVVDVDVKGDTSKLIKDVDKGIKDITGKKKIEIPVEAKPGSITKVVDKIGKDVTKQVESQVNAMTKTVEKMTQKSDGTVVTTGRNTTHSFGKYTQGIINDYKKNSVAIINAQRELDKAVKNGVNDNLKSRLTSNLDALENDKKIIKDRINNYKDTAKGILSDDEISKVSKNIEAELSKIDKNVSNTKQADSLKTQAQIAKEQGNELLNTYKDLAKEKGRLEKELSKTSDANDRNYKLGRIDSLDKSIDEQRALLSQKQLASLTKFDSKQQSEINDSYAKSLNKIKTDATGAVTVLDKLGKTDGLSDDLSKKILNTSNGMKELSQIDTSKTFNAKEIDEYKSKMTDLNSIVKEIGKDVGKENFGNLTSKTKADLEERLFGAKEKYANQLPTTAFSDIEKSIEKIGSSKNITELNKQVSAFEKNMKGLEKSTKGYDKSTNQHLSNYEQASTNLLNARKEYNTALSSGKDDNTLGTISSKISALEKERESVKATAKAYEEYSKSIGVKTDIGDKLNKIDSKFKQEATIADAKTNSDLVKKSVNEQIAAYKTLATEASKYKKQIASESNEDARKYKQSLVDGLEAQKGALYKSFDENTKSSLSSFDTKKSREVETAYVDAFNKIKQEAKALDDSLNNLGKNGKVRVGEDVSKEIKTLKSSLSEISNTKIDPSKVNLSEIENLRVKVNGIRKDCENIVLKVDTKAMSSKINSEVEKVQASLKKLQLTNTGDILPTSKIEEFQDRLKNINKLAPNEALLALKELNGEIKTSESQIKNTKATISALTSDLSNEIKKQDNLYKKLDYIEKTGVTDSEYSKRILNEIALSKQKETQLLSEAKATSKLLQAQGMTKDRADNVQSNVLNEYNRLKDDSLNNQNLSRVKAAHDAEVDSINNLKAKYKELYAEKDRLAKDILTNKSPENADSNLKRFKETSTDLLATQAKLKEVGVDIDSIGERSVKSANQMKTAFEQAPENIRNSLKKLIADVDNLKLKPNIDKNTMSELDAIQQKAREKLEVNVDVLGEEELIQVSADIAKLTSTTNKIVLQADTAQLKRDITDAQSTLASQLKDMENQFAKGGFLPSSSISAFKSELQSLSSVKSPEELASRVKGISSALSSATSQAKSAQAAFNNLNVPFFQNLANSFKTFGLGYMLTSGLRRGFSESLKTIKEMDAAMVDMAKVAKGFSNTSEAKAEVRNMALEVSTQVARSSEEIIYGMGNAFRSGLANNMEDALTISKKSAILANVSNIAQEDADRYINSIINSFDKRDIVLDKLTIDIPDDVPAEAFNGLKESIKNYEDTYRESYTELDNLMDMVNFIG